MYYRFMISRKTKKETLKALNSFVKYVAAEVILLLFLILFTGGPLLAKDDISGAESDSLGLIIKSIDVVEEKPVMVEKFNVKTCRSIEYTVGDYVEGKLLRDILSDRVVLYDELSRHQYVLIYNDVVSAEDEEDAATSLIKIKEKKRDQDGMNVTYVFNNYLIKAQGKEPFKLGSSNEGSEEEAKLKLENYSRDFQTNSAGFNKSEPLATDSVSVSKDRESFETESVGVQNVKNSSEVTVKAAEDKLNGSVEVKIDSKPPGAKSVTPAKTSSTSANKSTAPAVNETSVAPKASNRLPSETRKNSVSTQKTSDGTTVKIRDGDKNKDSGNILDE